MLIIQKLFKKATYNITLVQVLWTTHNRPYWTTVSQLRFLHPFSSVQIQHSASQQKSDRGHPAKKTAEKIRGSQVSPAERMAKLKSMHQSANSGNLRKVEVTCNHVEKVKTMRCFWEMKFEPEVSMQAQICSILSIFPRYQKHQQGVVKHSFSHASFTAQTYHINTIYCTLTYWH